MTDRKTASTINDTELDALYAELDRLTAELADYDQRTQQLADQLAALRTVARGYCHACGRGDAAPTADDWEQQKQRADQAEELLSIAHDTSNRSEAARARAVQRAETAEYRLDLAHQARRAKEHQLDDIRRALCDTGYIADDDPYSHADLADVIRQTAPAEATLDRVRDLRDDLRDITGARYIAEALDNILGGQPTPDGPPTRHVHVTITNPDEYTANRAALSLADWIHAEFPGHQVTTDAREWDESAPAEEQP